MSESLNAILHPFARGLLAPPAPGRTVFLRAEWAPELDELWPVCEQSFRPAYDALQARGFRVIPALSETGFDLGLCLLTKHKAENLANIARVWGAVNPGGVIVCAGRIDSGAASIARLVEDAAGPIEMLAKYHCKVFWLARTDETPAAFEAWRDAGRQQQVPETGYVSCPGIYSWNKVDRGSALLVDQLPADLGGRIADLGAGWGYLSAEILQRYPAVASLDLFEAEALALEAARANLDLLGTSATLRHHWADVRNGVGGRQFDAIVMNPPFHEGKDADMALGTHFIAAAAAALVPGGRLFMVANRQLPYEQALKTSFRRSAVLCETGLYKVITAST